MEALLSAKTEAQVLVLILIVMEDTHGDQSLALFVKQHGPS